MNQHTTPAFSAAPFLASLLLSSCMPLAAWAEVWITSPQLCRGKAYSQQARKANWQFDEQRRVSVASPDSTPMSTSVFPGADADFVVNVRVQLKDQSVCRLTLGKHVLDISNAGGHTLLAIKDKQFKIANESERSNLSSGRPSSEGSWTWTLLTVKRRQGKLVAQVNGQTAGDLGASAEVLDKIELRSIRGPIAVSNFVVTGNVQRRTPRQQLK